MILITALWTAWNDIEKEGIYSSIYNSSEVLPVTQNSNWAGGEPNGRETENCLELKKDYSWNDITCEYSETNAAVCIVDQAPYFTIRGIAFNITTCHLQIIENVFIIL